MSTTGWVVALVFGFGVLFYIFGNRDTKEAYNVNAAQLEAQQAEFHARRARVMEGKSDPELEKRATEARARAEVVVENNAQSAAVREPAVKALEQSIERAYGVKP